MNSFSKKCTMFSQYFKENGSFGDLNMAFSTNKQHASPTTKNLLPMIEKSSPIHQDLNLSPKGDNKERSQMTIFYGGKVIVLDNFPEEKAKEIMGFATKQSSNNTSVLTPSQADFVAANTPFINNPLVEGDMPIMRNRSLARFIAKRKDRIRAKAPYQTNGQDASITKPLDDNNKTWLGLAANDNSSSSSSSNQLNELQFL